MSRAQKVARLLLALSVDIPVLAYICRYNFEMQTNAILARKFGVHAERRHIDRKL